ncbi:hypothetical protein ACQPZJ_34435 [Actinoplanes sp. CA-054009]
MGGPAGTIRRVLRAPDGSWNKFGIVTAFVIGLTSAVISFLALLEDKKKEAPAPAGPVPSASWPAALDDCRPAVSKLPAGPAACLAARGTGVQAWSDELTLTPHDSFEIIAGYANLGAAREDDVVVSVALPGDFTYLPGSSLLYSSKTPDGGRISDHIVDRGVNIGSYAPAANAYVKFTVMAAAPEKFYCGPNTIPFRVKIDLDDGSQGDELVLKVDRKC